MVQKRLSKPVVYTIAIGAISIANMVPLAPAQAGVAEWEKHMTAGGEAYRESRYGEAEREFQTAIKEAESLGPNDLRLAGTLTNLGVLYNSRGNWNQAEPLFARAIDIKEKALGPLDVEVIDGAAKLCHFYLKKGRYDKADPLCQKIILFGDLQIKDYKNMETSFRHLDEFYAHHREFEKARKLFVEAQSMTRGRQNNHYLELAVLQDRLAAAYSGRAKNGRYPEAEHLYKQALVLREHCLSGNHMGLAQSYANLGKLYATEGRYAIAEPLLKQGFEISERTVGFGKPQTYSIMSTYCEALSSLGQGAQAEKLYRRALESFTAEHGSSSGYVAQVDLALASLLSSHGRYGEAASLMGHALSIEEKIRGPQHASLVEILDKYASMLSKANRQKEASRMAARANSIRG
jgi:hypothetical protein